MKEKIQTGVMLNAYPDSLGGSLEAIVQWLKRNDVGGAFSAFYILPSVFNSDLDRGFSIIDYSLNPVVAKKEDLAELNRLGIACKFDFVLNHLSVLSKPFQSLLEKGERSSYKDFFINWNTFWQGHGTMNDEGIIEPDAKLLENMVFRKAGLPLLKVTMPDGRDVPYWNTFYQEVITPTPNPQTLMKALDVAYPLACYMVEAIKQALSEDESLKTLDLGTFNHYRDELIRHVKKHRQYLGQMDVNIHSPLVWEFYEDTLKKLASYGARIVRLDAFAYAHKAVGEANFFNEPGTWELLEKISTIANQYNLDLLPEIHAKYEDKVHQKVAEKGYHIYDFFLPGLLIYALENANANALVQWIQEIIDHDYQIVTMLGCHDGIPLLDLKGLLPDEAIDTLINTVVRRGGYVKDLHGKRNVYYQVNATYYSALGENDQKLLCARAIHSFMPGIVQVWYLDLLAGKNDIEALKSGGVGSHKAINRTNYTQAMIDEAMKHPLVQKQLRLLHFRNRFKAFSPEAIISVNNEPNHHLRIHWQHHDAEASLLVDLKAHTFSIEAMENAQSVDWKTY